MTGGDLWKDVVDRIHEIDRRREEQERASQPTVQELDEGALDSSYHGEYGTSGDEE